MPAMGLLHYYGFYTCNNVHFVLAILYISHLQLCTFLPYNKQVNGKYILKRVVSEVLFNYLINKKVINNIIKNRYGRIFTYYDSCFWVLCDYIEGREFSYFDNSDLDTCAKYLKEFQINTPSCSDIKFHDNFSVEKWFNDTGYLLNHTFNLINQYYGEVPEVYKNKLVNCLNGLTFSIDDYNNMKKAISHGEFQNTNVFMDKEDISVIDWDSLSIRPRLFDIVSSSCYLCRTKRGAFNIDMQRFNRYLNSFNLTNIERNNIKNMVFISFVPKEDTIEKFYVKGKKSLSWYLGWTVDAMVSILSKL